MHAQQMIALHPHGRCSTIGPLAGRVTADRY